MSDSPSSFTVSMSGKLSEMDNGFIMLSRDILEDEMYFSEKLIKFVIVALNAVSNPIIP